MSKVVLVLVIFVGIFIAACGSNQSGDTQLLQRETFEFGRVKKESYYILPDGGEVMHGETTVIRDGELESTAFFEHGKFRGLRGNLRSMDTSSFVTPKGK
ncbi:MAG: hypothetical protein ACSHYF_08710 [Verrucomicrobiaceae bacterium]